MVAGVDIAVTISDKKHTEVVVEQALELGVPVLPIPDFHGDSEQLLRDYRDRLAAAFNPGALAMPERAQLIRKSGSHFCG